jgi:hypothetical protein
MKSLAEYLIESKQTYEFKIKLVGDDHCPLKMQAALARFDVASFSHDKTTPIQTSQIDFPVYENVAVSLYDVVLNYPAIAPQLESLLAEALGITQDQIKVRSAKESDETLLNHQYDELSGEALLGAEYEKSNNQDLVGEKQKMALLKELSKTKHQGTQYKGVNDQLLAKKLPTEKSTTTDTKYGTTSAVGSTKRKVGK